MDYDEQLGSVLWIRLREAALSRNDGKCEHCSRRATEVHHKQYIYGRKAWEYALIFLQSLCRVCHSLAHAQPIPVIDELGVTIGALPTKCFPCERCKGTGNLPEFNHIQHGICFKCVGAGFIAGELNRFISEKESFKNKDLPF